MKREKRKEILIVHNEIPGKNHDVRTYNQIKELSKYYRVSLLTISYSEYIDSIKDIEKYCEIIHAPFPLIRIQKINVRIIIGLALISKKILGLVTYNPRKSESALLKHHRLQTFCLKYKLKKILSKRDFDYIQVEHFYLSKVILNVNTKARKIIDFHNVHSSMENSHNEELILAQEERGISEQYNLAICCSEIEKNRLKENGYSNILVVPNGVASNYLRGLTEPISDSSVLFVGKLNYEPNYKGIKYFLKVIYPSLEYVHKINIIGKWDKAHSFREEPELENVHFHGYVENIEPYFDNAIFICPLLDGGGTRQKILTAFALGAPVVSTSKGAEGIEYTHGENILIADTASQFAQAIDFLSKNPSLYKKLRNNARKVAEDKYNWNDIVRNYHTYLETTLCM